jgi:Meiotically up-regulated gene 113
MGTRIIGGHLMYVYLIGNTIAGCCKIGVSNDSPKFRLLKLDEPKLPFEPVLLAQYHVETKAAKVRPAQGLLNALIEDMKTPATEESRTEGFYIERALHAHFKDRRLRGEWFDYITPEVFVKAVKHAHDSYRRDK